jgi:translation initiation factor IF-1
MPTSQLTNFITNQLLNHHQIKMKSILYIFACLLFFTSCEKVIDLDLKENQSKIVIEGNITNEAGPYYVKITQSTVLSDTSKTPTIHNAVVAISDNQGTTETLTFIGNGTYQTKNLRGMVGRTYTLTVKIGTETYTAQSTMPVLVPLDTIKLATNTFGGEIDYDFIPVYTDPATTGDIYRFLLTINEKLMKAHFILNDQVENGVVNKQHLQNIMELKLKTGDVVKIQMQKVDSKVGLYYTTLVQNTDTGPGGGTTPNNPPNNISNGALGIFSAHTVQEKSVVVPK